MTDLDKDTTNEMFEYGCIDEDLGSNMWRLDATDTAPGLRKRLETHLSFCADCRMQQRVTAETARGLSEGFLKLPTRDNHQIISRSITASGFLALAASLLLMFMLPPVPAQQKIVVRGNIETVEIFSPVADEIIRDANPIIRWQPLANATSYNVRIEGVDSEYKWEQKTSNAEIQIPADKILPISERFRVFVEPMPAYLGPTGGWRSSFSTATMLPFVKYRVGAAPPETRSLGLFALGLLIMGALTPLIWKRRLEN